MKILKSLFLVGALLLSVQGVFAQVSIGGYTISSQPTANASAVVCTADAKICADGSYVGRSGPNCAFICPSDGDIPPVTSSECVDLTNNMFTRSRDSQTNGEVSLLQDFLSPRYLNNDPTGFFGRLTLAGVKSFQRDNGLRAFGYVGPATRAKIKQLTCGGTSQTLAINSMSPSVAKVGQTIALSGPGLNSGGDYVFFDGYRIETDGSQTLNRIGFVVPEYLSHSINCIQAPCPLAPVRQVVPGSYSIQVVNNQGTTNTVTLQVIHGTSTVSPNLSSLSPVRGSVGTEVTVFGRSINTGSEKVYFAGSRVFPLISSATDQRGVVRFRIPQYITPCGYEDNVACPMIAQLVTPGNYEIVVKNNNGLSNTISFTVTSVTTVAPIINSLSPSVGLVGTEIAISGDGINVGGDQQIYFGGSLVTDAVSSSADTVNVLRFRVPGSITPCGVGGQNICKIASRPVTPGTYEVAVVNSQGTSNTLSFTVTSSTTNPPTIFGVSGPQTLNVNQQGTWTVTASNPSGGNLSYSVVWGDEAIAGTGSQTVSAQTPQQTATFTRAYSRAGLFTPRFIVTNANGQSATASLSVNVGNTTIPTPTPTPTITSFTPTSGPNGSSITVSGTNFVTNSPWIHFLRFIDAQGNAVGNASTIISVSSSNTATFSIPTSVPPGTYRLQVRVTSNATWSNASAQTFTVTGQTSTLLTPTITSLSPTARPIGTRVTAYGTNINTNAEYVLFRGFRIATDGPKVADQVSFYVPGTLSNPCPTPSSGLCPPGALIQVTPGAYSVEIGNANGVSNTLTFNVISYSVEEPLITKFQVENVTTASSFSRRLVWTTQFASSCTASGAWSGAQLANGSHSIGFMSQPLKYILTCVNSQGAFVSSSVTTEPTTGTGQVPVVSTISPSSGGTGVTVTISGTNLTSATDMVWFGGVKFAPNRNGNSSNTLTFVVPTTLFQCNALPGQECTVVAQPTPLGNYNIKVENASGVQSNPLNYQVTSNGSSSNF